MSGRAGVLQRKCACGAAAGLQGECDECKKKKGAGLQRRAIGSGPAIAPRIVHDVLRTPGQPLDAATRAFMEPRFAYDFSKVRVHADGRADESARAVSAEAYTVGQDIVFGEGQYTPRTESGRKLVAHELAHVVQQSAPGFSSNFRQSSGEIPVGSPADESEQHADTVANGVLRTGSAQSIDSGLTSQAILRRQTAATGDKDPDRDKILAVANRAGDPTSRAWELVWRMLSRYFPEYVKRVAGVAYRENEPSVRVDVTDSGPKDKKVQSAIVAVGKKFMDGISDDSLRGKIEELASALSSLRAAPDPKAGQGTGIVWKIIHDKLPKKTNRIAGTSYDANLPGLRTEFKSGEVQAGKTKVAWSAPMLYFGTAFVDLPDPDKESKLREEFKVIDKWAVENFHIRKNDLDDEDITLRIRGLSTSQLTEFRDKTQDLAVKTYVSSLIKTSTPLEKGLQMGADGKETVVIGAVTVIVEPDILDVPKITGGVTKPSRAWRIPKPTVDGGRVTAFTPPTITITIRTKYGVGSKDRPAGPDVISAYGRGTTERDKALGATTLRAHEGSHGLDFIQYIRDHPFPTFTGAVGMTVAQFRNAEAAFTAAVDTYGAALESFSVKRTDCTGLTIDQYDDQHHIPHPVQCGP
jgi:hypothetical protein